SRGNQCTPACVRQIRPGPLQLIALQGNRKLALQIPDTSSVAVSFNIYSGFIGLNLLLAHPSALRLHSGVTVVELRSSVNFRSAQSLGQFDSTAIYTRLNRPLRYMQKVHYFLITQLFNIAQNYALA